jgi:p-hydroxybenzoate 3-monooxygenase
MDTQVGIVGAGPAGLLLAHLLHLRGIESVVLEARSREYVEARVRAGVLEQTTVDLLDDAGVAERLHREGLVHHGLELRFDGRGHRIDFSELTDGRAITVYGQQEVVKDLIAARLQAGGELRFEVQDVTLHALASEQPRIRFSHEGADHELSCDVVAGCDGFHGISRPTVPDGVLRIYEREYPFAWLGILAEVAPSNEELIYCHHDRGFALHSMRSPTLTRLYLQCAPDADIEEWPDERIWEELQTRLATTEGDFVLEQGPLVEKGITPMRSFVAEPLRHGRLFLAGDAAHIVPPTGAKGLNLAFNDVRVLFAAIEKFYAEQDSSLLDSYSEDALERIWKAQNFSYWMTSMLHTRKDATPFEIKRALGELNTVVNSEHGKAYLAEGYTGWPTK